MLSTEGLGAAFPDALSWGAGQSQVRAEEDGWTRETAGGDDRSMTQMMTSRAGGRPPWGG